MRNKTEVLDDDFEGEGMITSLEDYTVMFEEYVGQNLENVYEVPLFDGQARMTAYTRLPAKHFDIWAEVSAVCGTGALVSASGKRDHFWLGLMEDKAFLRWDAGSGPLELLAGKVKIDGRNKLSARRYKKDAVLKLGSAVARGSAQGRMTSLDVDQFLYIGNPPENVTKLSEMYGLSGFVGCVHRLRVSGRDVIPPERGLTLTSHGLRPCTPHNLAQLVCP